MHFSTPVLTLLAIAAGVQAGGKQHEPPIHKRSVSAQATPVSTGAHPIVTGTPGGGGNAGNATSGGNATTGGGAGGAGGASSSGAASSGAASGSAASNTPASPSSTGFVPSSPGIKVSVPQLGMIGAGIGSVAYGALIFLA